jgi:hypothetical protein
VPNLRPEDFENLANGAPQPWCQPGGYIARWLGGEIRFTPWGEKLYFSWRIYLTLRLDERDSIVVYRYHDLTRDGGGRFVFGALHSYRRDWIAANWGKYPSRFNSLPYSVFEGKNILVEVRTVETAAGGVPIPTSCHYSTIRRVVRPVEDGESFTTYPLEVLKEAGKKQ